MRLRLRLQSIFISTDHTTDRLKVRSHCATMTAFLSQQMDFIAKKLSLSHNLNGTLTNSINHMDQKRRFTWDRESDENVEFAPNMKAACPWLLINDAVTLYVM